VSKLIRLLFRILTPLTDRIVLAKPFIANDFPSGKDKLVYVQNYASLSSYRPAKSDQLEKSQSKGCDLTAIHLGLISEQRGWPQLLEALSLAKSKSIRIRIVGTFNDGSHEKFQRRLCELGLDRRFVVEDWLPFDEAYERVQASHIGLILLQPGVQNHVYALPHKMFDYMLAGLPVIAPRFAEEVARIITVEDCGILVDPKDPFDIAGALDSLERNPDLRRRLGENGRKAVLQKYNWEREAKRLTEMYRELATSG
jgi:glycosyltransferase involved in cell wall biosynthesis